MTPLLAHYVGDHEWIEVKMKEIWRSIDFIPIYTVSNLGRVKKIPAEYRYPNNWILKQFLNYKGYPMVRLRKPNKKRITIFVHKLVAEAFLGSRPKGMEINHKDCNKQNNYISNLEYVTQRENARHAYINGLLFIPKGQENGNHKLTDRNVKEILKLAKCNLSWNQLAFKFGVCKGTIGHILMGRNWKHITHGGRVD